MYKADIIYSILSFQLLTGVKKIPFKSNKGFYKCLKLLFTGIPGSYNTC